MSDSSHIRSVLIGVEYQNCRQTLDVYLLLATILIFNANYNTTDTQCLVQICRWLKLLDTDNNRPKMYSPVHCN